MRLVNPKQICDVAAAKGFGVPALNNNGGTYDIGRAIIEAAEELQSPLIIACCEPNLEYGGFEYAAALIKFLAADTTIPLALGLDHGRTPQSVVRAVRAGFTHVMIDYADRPLEENVRGTQQIIVQMPLVQHGTCGISLGDITRLVKAGMTEINFGEGLRMNYIRYFNEFSRTLKHEHHAGRIARAAKDRLKEDIKDIIRAVGSEGKAEWNRRGNRPRA